MVRKYKRLEKPYNDATLKVAMDEIAAGASIKATSRKHMIGYGKLWSEHAKH